MALSLPKTDDSPTNATADLSLFPIQSIDLSAMKPPAIDFGGIPEIQMEPTAAPPPVYTPQLSRGSIGPMSSLRSPDTGAGGGAQELYSSTPEFQTPAQPPKSFAGTADQYLNLPDGARQSATTINIIGDDGPGDALEYGVRAPADDLEPLQRAQVEQARGAARVQQEQRALDSMQIRAARQQLRSAEAVLTEQRKMLPTGMAMRDLERFVSQADSPLMAVGGGVTELIKKEASGESLSRRERRFLGAYQTAAQTLERVRQIDQALAAIPMQDAQIVQQARVLAAQPMPMAPEEAESITRAKFAEDAEIAAGRQLREQRGRLKERVGDVQDRLKGLDEPTDDRYMAIEEAVFADAQEAGLFKKVKGRLQPKDEASQEQYDQMLNEALGAARAEAEGGEDLQALSGQLDETNRRYDESIGLRTPSRGPGAAAAPAADLTPQLQKLKQMFPQFSEAELIEALQ